MHKCARSYALARLAVSSKKAYEEKYWRIWVAWRTRVGKESVDDRGRKRGSSCRRVSGIHGILQCSSGKQGVNGKGLVSMTVITSSSKMYCYLEGVRQGIKRRHVEKGTQTRTRRPLTRGMLSYMEGEMERWNRRERGKGTVARCSAIEPNCWEHRKLYAVRNGEAHEITRYTAVRVRETRLHSQERSS